jgi:hypothetical protein
MPGLCYKVEDLSRSSQQTRTAARTVALISEFFRTVFGWDSIDGRAVHLLIAIFFGYAESVQNIHDPRHGWSSRYGGVERFLAFASDSQR